MKTLLFILSALWHRNAHIDLDGCLLRRMRTPDHVPPDQALDWWMVNLAVTPIVYRRLVLLYVLRLLGVTLHIWTNRWPQHGAVTRKALGPHLGRLFSYQTFCSGKKHLWERVGPCMDDQPRYIGTRYADLLVKQL